MRLYHGTSTAALPGILADGITSRIGHRDTHWSDYPSKPYLVYLTSAYPLFFAINAVKTDDNGNNWESYPVILEVETFRLDLLPDEDFVAQVLWNGKQAGQEINRERFGNPQTLRELNDVVDPRQYNATHAMESLANLGTCAVNGHVPVANIKRIAVLDPNACPLIMYRAMDPSISINNFRFVGHDYRALVALVMDGTPLPRRDGPTEFDAEQDRFHAALLAERNAGVHVFDRGRNHSSVFPGLVSFMQRIENNKENSC